MRIGATLAIGVVGAAFALAPARGASAQPNVDIAADPDVTIEAAPVLQSTLPPGGLGEIIVSIENHHDHVVEGVIGVRGSGWSRMPLEAEAPYRIDGGGAALVHVPIRGGPAPFVEARDATGRVLFHQELATGSPTSVRVADLEEVSRLGLSIGHAAVDTEFRPQSYYGGYSGTSPSIDFVTPRIAHESGEPILPTYAVGWQGVHLAIVPSDTLASLRGAELESLSAFVMGGGTLAVVVRRPEDLRSDTVASFAGGEVSETRAQAGEFGAVELAPVQPPAPERWSPAPSSPLATTEVVGYSGGNLATTRYGASAAYGLGEFVVLGFDPTKATNAEDPWVQMRIVALARAAYERRAIAAVDLGGAPVDPGWGPRVAYDSVRRLLDPNEGARWGIGVAAALLCLYAVLAGPVAFSRAKKKNKPLLALAFLPVASIVAFLLIVGLGFVAKGTGARSRRLTFVDLGAGMHEGAARRYRGFFSSKSALLDVVPTRMTSAIAVGGQSDPGELDGDQGVTTIDRAGAYLANVPVAPWQTLVVREDGIAPVGGGIAVSEVSGSSELVVKNATGHALRGVVVKLANDRYRFVGKMDAGQVVDTTTSDGKGPAGFTQWVALAGRTQTFGRAQTHPLDAGSFPVTFGGEDYAHAWQAIEAVTPRSTDWFPSGAPVVIGEMVANDGDLVDNGMEVDSDRTFLRVVGYGGEP